jgi:hypothetical protein
MVKKKWLDAQLTRKNAINIQFYQRSTVGYQ